MCGSRNLGLIVGLFVTECHGLGQTPPAVAPLPQTDDAVLYETFFKQVVQVQSAAQYPDVRLNVKDGPGKTTFRLVVPNLQDVIGLTDAEADLLNATAADCMAA